MSQKKVSFEISVIFGPFLGDPCTPPLLIFMYRFFCRLKSRFLVFTDDMDWAFLVTITNSILRDIGGLKKISWIQRRGSFVNEPFIRFWGTDIPGNGRFDKSIKVQISALTSKTKGRVTLPNRMNFRKNSTRPKTPPLPSFSENYIANVLYRIWLHMQGGMRGR